MMEISSLTSPSSTNTQSSSGQSASLLSSDFETFLQMLTAQARYQDPLEPIDSTEYAAQLAQFSMVEQQVQSNNLLTALAAQLGASNMAQMSNWIGMEARSTSAASFTGDPIDLNPRPALGADEATLVVYNEAGAEVQRVPLPLTNSTVEWNGLQDDNTPFPDGLYRFDVESSASGTVIAQQPVETYSRVTEARVENGATVLVLAGGVEVPADNVTGLREGTPS